MKKFFLSALLLFAFVVESTAQWGTMKSLLESIPVTAPPTSDMSKQLKKWVVLNEENRKFPDVIYRDFQRTQPEVPIRIGKSTALHIASSGNPVMIIIPFWAYPSGRRM